MCLPALSRIRSEKYGATFVQRTRWAGGTRARDSREIIIRQAFDLREPHSEPLRTGAGCFAVANGLVSLESEVARAKT